ncbi:hypothetical protein [uncultured Mediterranea sp.]|uniref:hypothetical protein n=1 Tax=uncultured Mediterranea sp. TaxID=1926662 RepID=UPI0027D93A50|nr:hypothetical protein [uncultured Mediterranea sp.]
MKKKIIFFYRIVRKGQRKVSFYHQKPANGRAGNGFLQILTQEERHAVTPICLAMNPADYQPNATAKQLHTFCSIAARRLQQLCKGLAVTLQGTCSDSAKGLQYRCKRSAKTRQAAC